MKNPSAAGLICPDCHSSLESLERCIACGLEFPLHGAVRKIMAQRPRSVTVDYHPTDPILPPDDVMRFPARSGQRGGAVYHLDLAHAEVLMALPKGSRILEVGCGGGQMRAWAQAHGLDYVGIDVASDRVHDWLREHGGPDVYADAHALPFADAQFDAVYAAAVWEHLAVPALATQEALRVLKPGGVMLGSMSFLEPWHDASQIHMTPAGIDRMLRLAGFSPRLIWPEIRWTGFRAIMEMGNKVTRALRGLSWFAYGAYLAPKLVQHLLRARRWPRWDDLYHPVANIAGAIAWIADKPGPATAAPLQGGE